MIEIIFRILAFLLATCILVAVHEYGHFIIARLCNIKVLNFSLGFGPKLFSKKSKAGTLFSISAIPLGGYVKMLDEREAEQPIAVKDLPYVFNRKSPWKKLAVVVAGPVFNFILAFFAFYFMFLYGIDVQRPVIQYIEPDSVAEQAGLSYLSNGIKQEITAIDNIDIYSVEDLQIALAGRLGTSGNLVIKTKDFTPENNNINNNTNSYNISLNNWYADINKEPITKSLGIWLSPKEQNSLIINAINSANDAVLNGLKVGDVIVGYNNTRLKNWDEFLTFIKNNPKTNINLEIKRDNKIQKLPITIGSLETKSREGIKKIGYLGITIKYPFYLAKQNYGVIQSVSKAFYKTLYYVNQTFYMVYKLITGQLGLDTVRGPVMVAKAASVEIQMGLSYFLNFLGIISIGLGVINLLPIPVLDGGHVVYHLYEVCTGKSASMLAEKIGVVIGGVFLALLMCVAFYNDIIYW